MVGRQCGTVVHVFSLPRRESSLRAFVFEWERLGGASGQVNGTLIATRWVNVPAGKMLLYKSTHCPCYSLLNIGPVGDELCPQHYLESRLSYRRPSPCGRTSVVGKSPLTVRAAQSICAPLSSVAVSKFAIPISAPSERARDFHVRAGFFRDKELAHKWPRERTNKYPCIPLRVTLYVCPIRSPRRAAPRRSAVSSKGPIPTLFVAHGDCVSGPSLSRSAATLEICSAFEVRTHSATLLVRPRSGVWLP